MAKKKNLLTVDRENLGEALHTALRKYCDSDPTSIAWNVIHLLKPKVWAEYLETVWKRLDGVKFTDEAAITTAVREASIKDWRIVGDYAGVSLQCAFKCFNASDWHAYAAMLYEC